MSAEHEYRDRDCWDYCWSGWCGLDTTRCEMCRLHIPNGKNQYYKSQCKDLDCCAYELFGPRAEKSKGNLLCKKCFDEKFDTLLEGPLELLKYGLYIRYIKFVKKLPKQAEYRRAKSSRNEYKEEPVSE